MILFLVICTNDDHPLCLIAPRITYGKRNRISLIIRARALRNENVSPKNVAHFKFLMLLMKVMQIRAITYSFRVIGNSEVTQRVIALELNSSSDECALLLLGKLEINCEEN
jgi:hypothetical protein